MANVTKSSTLYNLTGRIVSIPKIDNTLTKDRYAADAKVTGDELELRLKKTDVVDNLVTANSEKPLSANQGVEIKRQLDAINMSQAGTVGYNNTDSGLAATNMQSAIDEVASNIKDVEGDVETIASTVDKFADDYLKKNGGGMVKGTVKVQNADNGYGEVSKNNSDTADYGTQLLDATNDGKSAKVAVSAANDTFTYTDRDGNIRNVFHEGSKPFGEYKGNGSATPRTIDTKGIGRIILVYCSTHQAYITPKGADVIDLTTGERKWIDNTKTNYLSGKISLMTANEALNKANETYYYQGI